MSRLSAPDLSVHGLHHAGSVYAHLSSAALIEQAVKRGEGRLTERGALAVDTGTWTGRAPRDRFLVGGDADRAAIDWGKINVQMAVPVFERLHGRVLAYLQNRDLFVCDAHACADDRYRLPVRIIADQAWHALFTRCLLRSSADAVPFDPSSGLTILCASGFRADPAIDGTRSAVFIVLDLTRRIVLIGATGYAGEIKKAVFSHLNFSLPSQGVFPMHCSANIGADGRTALFFGLSGTGKTTLSADPQRRLIGDDEHGWSDAGVFNIEGGCYAKCIHLSAAGEPQIWSALYFGTVLENVAVDEQSRHPDFDDDGRTENTRAAYPLANIANAEPSSLGGHPDTVIFLTCDAFGVLPPVSRLGVEQAMYHFLSGYTARVAGTESGVTEPEATFSACFAAPFLPLHPGRYATLLQERLQSHPSKVWLVNTGWTGGPSGPEGQRIKLVHTRAMVRAILDGSLDHVPATPDAVFGIAVPEGCPGVPPELLQPRQTWASPAAYDAQARRLVELFVGNFGRYAGQVSAAVATAGPHIA